MATNDMQGWKQITEASAGRRGSTDSDKLAAIPGTDFNTFLDPNGEFTFGDFRNFNSSCLTEPLKPRPGSRDSLFAAFNAGSSEFQGDISSYAPLQQQYPDPSQAQDYSMMPYYENLVQPDIDNMNEVANIDPALDFGSVMDTTQVSATTCPKVRTNSGEDLPAVPSPDGTWLHPRTLRPLDVFELRWGDAKYPLASVTEPTISAPIATSQADQTPMFNMPGFAASDLQLPGFQESTFEMPDFGSEPEAENVPAVKRRKTSSQDRSAMKIVDKRRAPLYNAEAPRLDPERPWVRMNSSTKGNTRTGKTNAYGDGPYRNTQHPLGSNEWISNSGNRWRYNKWGELQGVSFEAPELLDYLYSHPFHSNPGTLENPRKLILWIQKMPGDSAKRVNTQHGLKCRVKECPAGIYKTRTINTGHYRVAFDEQYATYGDARNPMHVAGYAHLYCMERFFDFKAICQQLDVRADDREYPGEPTGEWVAGLGNGTEEYRVAKEFIQMAKTGYKAEQWTAYPRHDPNHPLARKLPHDNTLTHAMVVKKAASTGHSKMRMMQARGRFATQFFVNMGDLQLQIDAQQEKNAQRTANRGRATQKRRMVDDDEEPEEEDVNDSGDESSADPDGDYRPAGQRSSARARATPRTSRRTSSQNSLTQKMQGTHFGGAPVAQMGTILEDHMLDDLVSPRS